ncbi:MAG: cysteine hydrolase [Candidatus Latescibacteria bacterium]|nr:cysteine hydrolase [Candidatus Latescibacterota bacterium]
MPKMIFWDVDTQYDFMMPDGKLYVPWAEEIIPNLARLTNYARKQRIPILGSVDYHATDDPELSDTPDFHGTFPPHCLRGTPGQEKIPATRPLHPLLVESRLYPEGDLEKTVADHTGEVIFRKQRFDVFSNPNVDRVLGIIQPDEIVVYGVALDVCDAYAIEGLLKRRASHLTLVHDATKPIYENKGQELVEKWKREGVRVTTTAEITKE